MIADLDETLRQLLIEELPVKNGEIDISFHQPKREWSTRINRPTINLFLYDLRENPILRQKQWERTVVKGNGANLASHKQSPLRMDCFYMLTTWANEPDDEHRLLTRALLALSRFPLLPADRLIGTLQNPPFDIQAHLANHDRLTNPAEVWSALDNEMRPSISYIITLALDPWTEVTGPIVRTFSLRSGQALTLPRYQELADPEDAGEMSFIGGIVRAKGKDGPPLSGLQVAVKGTGFISLTNEEGRFRLGSLRPGEYTLVVWPEDGKPQEKAITIAVPVSSSHQDYDVEI
jgi:hypothetical protein